MGKNKGGGKPSGGGGGGGSSNGSSSNGYGGGAGPSKPKRPKSGSKLDNRYLYAACALAFAVAAVGFQQFVATSEPPEPPVPEAARSKPARKAKSEAAPPRKRAPPPPPPMGAGRIDPGCVDDHENCEYWAKSGECDNNKAFMHSSCKASCHVPLHGPRTRSGSGSGSPRRRGLTRPGVRARGADLQRRQAEAARQGRVRGHQRELRHLGRHRRVPEQPGLYAAGAPAPPHPLSPWPRHRTP